MHPSKNIKGSEGNKLKNQNIALCITGSVAAVKCVELSRQLMRQGAEVKVTMTEKATELVTPQLMQWATGNPVVTKLTGDIEHVELAQWADLILVAPSTANTLSKISCAIDDTTVTSLVSVAQGLQKPILIVPAMHGSMYSHETIQDNLEKLEETGIRILEPRIEEGKAKLPGIKEITEIVTSMLHSKDLCEKKVLVTAGPTREKIDPVKIITNESSGKMGVEAARAALSRGAEVTLILGVGTESPPPGVNTIRVKDTSEMKKAVMKELQNRYDVFISAAAPQDFTVKNVSEEKIRHSEPVELNLVPAPRILDDARQKAPETYLIGFKAECGVSNEELEKAAREKMSENELDMVVANDVLRPQAGFKSSTNEVLILSKSGLNELKSPKIEIANKILDIFLEEIKGVKNE
ncbi:MAG: bifunctional phosphopantothenoylcysteine decarboxylase/phosphopantothenate--cysteine ligase CoaBC [Hadesarchaea archaeon]|nr:bifunctional phosphopantothenoylcysteine decarboxylase/phosphopantothenate--cysteine ligase CoaBC [Hadesarchaea archaeon]